MKLFEWRKKGITCFFSDKEFEKKKTSEWNRLPCVVKSWSRKVILAGSFEKKKCVFVPGKWPLWKAQLFSFSSPSDESLNGIFITLFFTNLSSLLCLRFPSSAPLPLPYLRYPFPLDTVIAGRQLRTYCLTKKPTRSSLNKITPTSSTWTSPPFPRPFPVAPWNRRPGNTGACSSLITVGRPSCSPSKPYSSTPLSLFGTRSPSEPASKSNASWPPPRKSPR